MIMPVRFATPRRKCGSRCPIANSDKMKCGAGVIGYCSLETDHRPLSKTLLLCTTSVRDHATALAVVNPPDNANASINATLDARRGACLKVNTTVTTTGADVVLSPPQPLTRDPTVFELKG
jgi:hypothetical protein